MTVYSILFCSIFSGCTEGKLKKRLQGKELDSQLKSAELEYNKKYNAWSHSLQTLEDMTDSTFDASNYKTPKFYVVSNIRDSYTFRIFYKTIDGESRAVDIKPSDVPLTAQKITK